MDGKPADGDGDLWPGRGEGAAGCPNRSRAPTGAHGASARRHPRGATRFISTRSPKASATPSACASWPALPSLMVHPDAPASVGWPGREPRRMDPLVPAAHGIVERICAARGRGNPLPPRGEGSGVGEARPVLQTGEAPLRPVSRIPLPVLPARGEEVACVVAPSAPRPNASTPRLPHAGAGGKPQHPPQ